MIKKHFDVPLYDFNVAILEVENDDDAPALDKYLKSCRMSGDVTNEIIEAVKNGDVDGGWTISNLGQKRFVVVFLKTRTPTTRDKIVGHEKRHVEDDILKHCGVKDDEAAAYLAGFLSTKFK